MNRATWSKPTSPEEAYRRAGGRAKYNAKRFDAAFERRQQLLLMLRHKAPRRGDLVHLARSLGVSKATVCRDVALLRSIKSLGPADPTFADLMREFKRIDFH